MTRTIYPVRLRQDNPKADELKEAIMSATVEIKQEVLLHTRAMEQGFISSTERFETLDGRLQTYAFTLGKCSNRLLCDFDTRLREWNLLALSNGPNF